MKFYLQGLVSLILASQLLSCSMHETNMEEALANRPVSNLKSDEILFVSNQDGDREIYVIQSDDPASLKQLTNNTNDDYDASWSPDGSQIVFTSNRIPGNTEVFLMNSDGSGQINLTNSKGFDGRAQWSPDGSMIAFNSDRNGVEQIYLWHRKSGEVTQLTHNQYGSVNHVWSPDGKWLAYQNLGKSNKADLWITSADGKTTQALTSAKKSEDGSFDWSPDSSKIAFHSRRSHRYDLYVYDLNKQQEIKLTDAEYFDIEPKWSNDGQQIMFLSTRGEHGRTRICLMKNNGTEQRCITDSRYQIADANWLADGRILHSNWYGKRYSNVYTLDISSLELNAIAPEKGYQNQPKLRPKVNFVEISQSAGQ